MEDFGQKIPGYLTSGPTKLTRKNIHRPEFFIVTGVEEIIRRVYLPLNNLLNVSRIIVYGIDCITKEERVFCCNSQDNTVQMFHIGDKVSICDDYYTVVERATNTDLYIQEIVNLANKVVHSYKDTNSEILGY